MCQTTDLAHSVFWQDLGKVGMASGASGYTPVTGGGYPEHTALSVASWEPPCHRQWLLFGGRKTACVTERDESQAGRRVALPASASPV